MRKTEERYFDDYDALREVFGELDSNLKRIEDAFGVAAGCWDGALKISGEERDAELAMRTVCDLYECAKEKHITDKLLDAAIEINSGGAEESFKSLTESSVSVYKSKTVKPKSLGQKRYLDAIRDNSIVFGVGPAGTGKTYLAVALAVNALKEKQVERIILTRPAVEAGEKLGFLPGDLSEKVDPYLRPLYDALADTMGDAYVKNIENGVIEIAPLAYMRGRTLSKCFIILDEAQNTTREQMKMFLTRMGENSRIVVTGDVTQIDLPRSAESGLKHATAILKDIKGIEIVRLTGRDVVRHPLVTDIIRAYENAEKQDKEETSDAKSSGENE